MIALLIIMNVVLLFGTLIAVGTISVQTTKITASIDALTETIHEAIIGRKIL